MTRIKYIKSFSGSDHDAVLQEYQDFYNGLVGEEIGDQRTEFLVCHSAISTILTIVFRAYEA